MTALDTRPWWEREPTREPAPGSRGRHATAPSPAAAPYVVPPPPVVAPAPVGEPVRARIVPQSAPALAAAPIIERGGAEQTVETAPDGLPLVDIARTATPSTWAGPTASATPNTLFSPATPNVLFTPAPPTAPATRDTGTTRDTPTGIAVADADTPGGGLARRRARRAAAPEPRGGVQCIGLTAQYRGRDTPTIQDVDFVLPIGGLVAVVGPSGSGKSTLCAAMLGEVGKVSGQVILDGVDLIATPAMARRLVSFVPQRDALHNELTPRQSLRLTAELRLAPAVSAVDRERRVVEVLTLLEILEHADRRIGQLSGGQRKRVAVAMELLSNPRLLMLDEPTSGLDEGLDRVMMAQLRRVANEGCAVLVVTHSTANLGLADAIIALDVKGRLAYVGPPAELLRTFEVEEYAEAMQALRGTLRRPAQAEGDPTVPAPRPVQARGRRAITPANGHALPGVNGHTLPGVNGHTLPRVNGHAVLGVNGQALPGQVPGADLSPTPVRPLVVPQPHPQPDPQAPSPPPELRFFHATWVLLRRELIRLVANRFTFARGTLLLPLLTVALTAFAADRGLAWTAQSPNTMQGAAMSVLVTCTTFFAMALSFSTIVGDRDVIEREHRWGVSPVSVVLAKALALLGPVVMQSVVTFSVYSLVRPWPDQVLSGWPTWPVMTLSLALLGVGSMGLGLLVSASSRTLERAIFLLMGCIAVLVVLTGLLIPLGQPNGFGGHLLSGLARISPTRWGTAAIGAYIGYVPNQSLQTGPADTSLLDAMWTHDVRHLLTAWAMTLSLAFVFVIAAARLLVDQARTRR